MNGRSVMVQYDQDQDLYLICLYRDEALVRRHNVPSYGTVGFVSGQWLKNNLLCNEKGTMSEDIPDIA